MVSMVIKLFSGEHSTETTIKINAHGWTNISIFVAWTATFENAKKKTTENERVFNGSFCMF